MAYLDENGLEHFWGKIKDHVSSAVAPKADDADVVHKTGDETVQGVKTFQSTASGHTAGETVTDLIIRNPEVTRGIPVDGGRSYTRVIFADAEGDTEETFAGRLGLLEVVSPKVGDTISATLHLGCYKFSSDAADAVKYTNFAVGYDKDEIAYATAPATSDDRTNSTDVVTRGYMEASEWNWQKTKSAAMVAFKPVPESDLEPVVDFMFTETPPVSGDKAPDNPSAIAGTSAIEIGRCGKNLLVYPYIEASHTFSGGLTATANSDGSVEYNGTSSGSHLFFSVTDGGHSGTTPCKIELAPGAQYTFSLKLVSGNVSNSSDIRLAIVDHEAGAYIGTCAIGTSMTFTAAHRHFRARLEASTGVSFSNVVVAPQLELGSTATPFEPYSGDEYTIQLGNTYYGGSLDVATGVMTVTWIGVILKGTDADGPYVFTDRTGSYTYNWATVYPTGIYSIFTRDASASPVCTHCQCYENIQSNDIHGFVNTTCSVAMGTAETSKEAFMSWVAEQYANGTPVTFVWKIVPYTISLSPTQIRSLPALDKYEPRINTVYTDQEAVQVGYQRFANYVDLTTDQTVGGTKNFTSNVKVNEKLILTTDGNIKRDVDTSLMYVCGGSSNTSTNGAYLVLVGSQNAFQGRFGLHTGRVNNSDKTFLGLYNGTLTWDGQNIQVSSDERIKTSLSSVPDAVLDAWEDVNWGQFQYLEAVASKGKDSARLHLGLIAQHVVSVFDKHGLDACAYGILCHEERPAVDEEHTVVDAEAYTDEEGVEHPAVTHVETRHEDAVDLWMVRYAEAQAMEACCMRRENVRLKKRIADLEERLAALELKVS